MFVDDLITKNAPIIRAIGNCEVSNVGRNVTLTSLTTPDYNLLIKYQDFVTQAVTDAMSGHLQAIVHVVDGELLAKHEARQIAEVL